MINIFIFKKNKKKWHLYFAIHFLYYPEKGFYFMANLRRNIEKQIR